MRKTILATLFAAALAIACHQQTPEAASASSVRNIITQDEIDSTKVDNVYDLIVRLHADYLRDRGKVSIKLNQRDRAVVFLNDQEYGIPETLRNRTRQMSGLLGVDAVVDVDTAANNSPVAGAAPAAPAPAPAR